MFQSTKDENLNLLMQLHDHLEDTMNTFTTINNLTQEELANFEE